ncbi:hypothetical protein L5F43_09865 [Aliarcobacter butzleri]|uniref:hypothetical protein n=1 Tax=Aliarcobacter butzleri TaxID=28197 RepID=UPI001EDC7DBB|nr:hypothetical protein [Aliarcobacter butzleri]MCG3688479.1 hypothetical protein [Aliarcobacter butzleri]MCG3706783.1 hypothetical protein [Aliarcobacter butzleri]MCT7557331.1 hypothetical protein [Aliarcobacter butzleri]MCT7557405.1 hypothetical protein [Aliarcobacter butzleri]MCT7592432.1 hypothetical protein [Aliarcobacter butzleri]
MKNKQRGDEMNEKIKELNQLKSTVFLIRQIIGLFVFLYIVFFLAYAFIKADYNMFNFVNWSEDIRSCFVIVFFIILFVFFVGLFDRVSDIETETGDKCDKKQ